MSYDACRDVAPGNGGLRRIYPKVSDITGARDIDRRFVPSVTVCLVYSARCPSRLALWVGHLVRSRTHRPERRFGIIGVVESFDPGSGES